MKCVGCGVDHKDAFDYCPSCGAPAPQAQPVALEDEVPPGTLLKNQYKIVGPIARGGMGTVYRGEDISLKRIVAIKVLPSKFNSDPELVKRFLLESQSAAALDHPNIVPIYTVGTDQGFNFFVMKLIQGETLTKLIRSRSLNAGSALHVVTQICDGLDAIHRAGYVHRDIKSSNVMVDSSGRVTLLDFGVLRQAEGSGAGALTKTGLVMGTPHYIAPEQARDSKLVDHRSDLYALGVVMYEVFAGRLPFIAANVIDVVMKHLTEMPPPLESINPSIPKSLSTIVMKALEKKKEDRFQSALEIKAALNHAAQALGYSVQSGTWTSLPNAAVTGAMATQTPVSGLTNAGTGVGSLRPQTLSYAPSAFEATVMPSQLPTGPTAFFGEAQIAARTRRKKAYVVGGVLAAAVAVGAVFVMSRGSNTKPPGVGEVAARGVDERVEPRTPTTAPPMRPAGSGDARGVSPEPARASAPLPTVPMAPRPEPPKALFIVSKMTEGAKLTVDGKEVPVPKNGELMLEPGRHVVEVSKAGFGTVRETIEFIAGTKRERSFILERAQPAKPTLGTLKIIAYDDSGSLRPNVWVNRQSKGQAPVNMRVPPGAYTVEVALGGYKAVMQKRVVRAGQTISVPFEMKKK
ncbi:MAG: serine/threonine protein kinase [Deltaproteobacteria bacterium]|nr:serine/threonine protein kinase [Deltaproteobacteria bacterium]